jgi:hypothetical protein
MKQEGLAPEPVLRTYIAALNEAILNARMRIRYGESIDMQELHDLLDGIHNMPQMLWCGHERHGPGWLSDIPVGMDLFADEAERAFHVAGGGFE